MKQPAHGDSMMSMTDGCAPSAPRANPNEPKRTFSVRLKKGKVRVKPSKGNAVAVKLSKDPDFVFRWELLAPRGYEFQLIFLTGEFDGVPSANNPWPFTGNGEGADGNATPWRQDFFEGSVVRDGMYKYSVVVRDGAGTVVGSLDPMIIVGRI